MWWALGSSVARTHNRRLDTFPYYRYKVECLSAWLVGFVDFPYETQDKGELKAAKQNTLPPESAAMGCASMDAVRAYQVVVALCLFVAVGAVGTDETGALPWPAVEEYRRWVEVADNDVNGPVREYHTLLYRGGGQVLMVGGDLEVEVEVDAGERRQFADDDPATGVPDTAFVQERAVLRSDDAGATWSAVEVSGSVAEVPAETWHAAGRRRAPFVQLPNGTVLGVGPSSVWSDDGSGGAQWRDVSTVIETDHRGDTLVHVPGWATRYMPAVVALHDGTVLLMGGVDDTEELRALNDVWQSTDDGVTWSEVTPAAPWVERVRHTAVVLDDDTVLIIGGCADDECSSYVRTVWRGEQRGSRWTMVRALTPWSQRADVSAAVLPSGGILVLGGEDADGGKSDVWHSPDRGESWALVTDDADFGDRAGVAVTVLADGAVLLSGGSHTDGGGEISGHVYISGAPGRHGCKWTAVLAAVAVALVAAAQSTW